MRVNELNLPKGSMQLVDNVFSQKVRNLTIGLSNALSSGGSAANTIRGLANLGVPTGFIGKVGNDEHGGFFEFEMKETGIQPKMLRSETPSSSNSSLRGPKRTIAQQSAFGSWRDDQSAGS